MAISDLKYTDYLWIKKEGDKLTGIRLSKNNLPTDTAYISDIPTSLKNPNALTFGKKTYDGSSAQTITASDLGALTSHQDISGKVNKSGDTMTGNLTPATNKGASLGTSSLYWSNIYGTTIYENGTSLVNKYLGKTAKAADADKLDGNDSTYYLNYNNLANKPTIPTAGTTASAVSTTASGGSATTWSKSDHVHSISLATGDNNGQVKIAGTNVSVKGLGSAAYTNSTAYATSGHTHSFSQITSRGEAFLGWGGKNFSGSYGPIDAAMVPELGANRLAFMPANAVTIEYSRDGGSTWTDYGPTNSQKIDLFNGRGSSFTIGKATKGEGNIATNKYQLRVNIYTSAGKVYTVLNKFIIYLSTNGTNNNWCTIRARKQSDYTAGNDKWTTFADKISVSGWSGYNVINTSGITTYGNTASTQYGHIQFIFGCDTGSTNNSYPGLQINKIFGFGGVGWTTPSTMAKTGQMYTYDSSQNVTFPAGVSAKSFTENGKTLSATYIAKSLTSTKGDMIYASAANTPARLAIGSNGQFLSIADGIPKWVNNPNSDTHYTNYLQIKGNGAEAVKFTQNADKSLNLKPGSNVSISAASGEITISSSDTNTSHSHSAGVGLVGSGSAGTSGTYTYKTKLRSETALTVDSAAATTTSGRVYPVAVDKSGYLSVNVPWTDTTYTFNGAVSTIKDSNLTVNRALISNGSGKVAVSDITSTELSYLDGASSNIQTQLNTLKGYFTDGVANKAAADGNGDNIVNTYATKLALSSTNSNVTRNVTDIAALQRNFDENGYAKVAVSAFNDTAGNDIMVTYATKKYVGDNFVKKTYEYKSGTVVDKIFTFKSTAPVTSLTYKDDSGNTMCGFYIAQVGKVQFKAPNGLQVYYNDDTTAYDVLTTNNMTAITTSEIDEICK